MTFANDNKPTAPVASKPVMVRKFSPCDPCLTLGELVRSTARFHVFTDRRGGGYLTKRQRRIACESIHLETV